MTDKPPPTLDEIREFERALQHLSCAELAQWMAEEKPFTILDVRTEGEWLSHRLAPARLVPMSRLEERLDEVLALPGPLVVHCEHGIRSFEASMYLVWQGRRDVFNLTEGLAGWTGPMEFGKP